MVALKDFIKKTLSEISDAVTEFGNEQPDNGGSPNPRGLHLNNDSNPNYLYAEYAEGEEVFRNLVISIDFDVTVIAEDDKKSGGGLGIRVFSSLKADAEHSRSVTNSMTQRIQFPIPLQLPIIGEKKAHRKVRKRGARRAGNRELNVGGGWMG